MDWLRDIDFLWEGLVLAALVLEPLLVVGTICWVLMSKKETTSVVAWCLTVFLLPLLGPCLFFLFGYQHVSKPLARKRKHRRRFQQRHTAPHSDIPEPVPGSPPSLDNVRKDDPAWLNLSRLAQRLGAFPARAQHKVDLYHEGRPAYAAMLEAIESARDHIHLEFFIIQPDECGRRCLEVLTRKAKAGVEVRLLYDAIGSHSLPHALLRPLIAAGGQAHAFLPINLVRRRVQINLRDHRKILIVDGQVGFTGGLNIGNEYLSRDPDFGFWRDTHLRLEGPAVNDLQLVFAENWDFAAGEELRDPKYYAAVPVSDGVPVQIVDSGPDRELKGIRETYYAAISLARNRVWIATPYFVPDAGLLDALCLAGRQGIDVRLLGQFHPDKWIPYFAGRYYWQTVLNAGVHVYQYTKGMMHSKVLLVDDYWGSVGSANLDNRSLHLNFEVTCLIYSQPQLRELEDAFRSDLASSIQLKRRVFGQRTLAARLTESACRLLSPVL